MSELPDDLSGLEPDVTIAILLTSVVDAESLAAVCSLAGVPSNTISTPRGAAAVLDDPRAGATSAAAVSALLAGTEVTLVERRSDVTAESWSSGKHRGIVPPGLVLAEAPMSVEGLILGSVAVADLEVVPSAGYSKFRALRILAGAAKRRRKARG